MGHQTYQREWVRPGKEQCSVEGCIDDENCHAVETPKEFGVIAVLTQPDAAICEWRSDGDSELDDCRWITDCGNDFILNEGGPVDNAMKFCCYCSKPLKEVGGSHMTTNNTVPDAPPPELAKVVRTFLDTEWCGVLNEYQRQHIANEIEFQWELAKLNAPCADIAARSQNSNSLHWRFVAGATTTACGLDAKDLRASLLTDFVDCADCLNAVAGWRIGLGQIENLSAARPEGEAVKAPSDLCISLYCFHRRKYHVPKCAFCNCEAFEESPTVAEAEVVLRKQGIDPRQLSNNFIEYLLTRHRAVAQERDALGAAIANAAQRAGIYNGEVSLTGPQLILLCDDLARSASAPADEVERALVELREMFPDAKFITVETSGTNREPLEPVLFARIQVAPNQQTGEEDGVFQADTLSLAMQAVREWKAKGKS